MKNDRLNKASSRDWVQIRMALLGACVLLIWGGLWYRAFQVQVVRGPELTAMAARQHKAAEFERGMRGEIFDRQGRLLAKSTGIQSVYVRPLELENPEAAVPILAAALEMPAGQVRTLLGRPQNFIWLSRQISDRNARNIINAGLRGVYLAEESARFYPHGHLAGQVLGFVGLDGEGLEGVEKTYDEMLAGRKATFVAQRDASGRRMYLDAQGREEDLRGRNVTLTLDAQIQFFAEEALAVTVKSFNGKTGMALVVHVPSGDILAMANYPFFNPNMPRQNAEQWRNRILLDALEPGSTLKPMLMAAALEERVITNDTIYYCEEGQWRLTGVNIRDVKGRGWLPANKILRYSSNICSAKIGLDLGATKYHDYLQKMGFGERSGLPLLGENPGLLRPPKSWYPVDLAAVSFGQGMSANALQMARAYLVLANRGVMRPLRLIRDPEQDVGNLSVVFREEVAQTVMRMLREVVEEDGTGTQARIPGVIGAGKTGTAQKATASGRYGDRYVASFAGFYPGDNPEYFIYVVVDEPHPQHYGGVVAAPAVRDIGLRSLAYAGKLPEGTVFSAQEGARGQIQSLSVQGTGVARAGLERSLDPSLEDNTAIDFALADALTIGQDMVPNVTGMSVRRAVERLRGFGVLPEVEGGGGIVSRQVPEPGQPWPAHERRLTLWLEVS
ncbi:penicillin-binding transpeptidase domain-containing protein [Desulfonatronum thiodismutans]|uniref:penicillin-binding transpeptidase domain-containing protein n=1 Tax=Desulfonatronum thiodismutans TaxID=159290 RepID=UPI0004ABDD1E|nr:penicillin-binding transpeptidase domain-containing protein [Desulfonatronum thiodismutans]